jgi:tRNA(Ile)-lysidine synthase
MAKRERSPALYEALKRFVQSNGLIQKGSNVLTAVSGGVDSVVMLDLLARLSSEWNLELAILHVNHQLRGRESAGDEKFVERLAEHYKVRMYTARVRTRDEAARKKISIQEAARHLRYAFFVAKRLELSADVVATAHNANDNAETMFLNFLRGTGIDGVAGIPLQRRDDAIVRPLLFATRPEIAAYAMEKKLKYREDSSNRTDKYSRNFVRRKIFPLLEKRLNPSLVKTFSNSSRVFRNCADFLEEYVGGVYPKVVTGGEDEFCFQREALRRQHAYVQQMVVHRAFVEKGIELSAERVLSLVSLLHGEKGSRIDCGNGWTAESGADHILLSRRRPGSAFSYLLEKEGTVTSDFFSLSVRKCRNVPNKLGVDSSIEYVDAGKVRFPLRVRSWRQGDAFVPLGMKHRKKVSDLFVDLKISRTAKERIPIVESNGNIVWIAGCRIDDRYKITPSSHGAYKLSISEV